MMIDESRRNTILCPGCGGRNDAAARECDWCGRLFVDERRQLDARWLAPAAVGGIVVLMLSVITFALVGSRSASRAPTAQAPTPPPAVVLDDGEEPEAIATQPTPRPSPTSTLQATETEVGNEYVRIANTGGSGAFIRREARAGAPGIVAYRDGTVLKIVGAETIAESRVWRQVEDRQGNRGWTPREYLDPSSTGF